MDAVGLKVARQTAVVACSFTVIDLGGVVAAPCRAVELATLSGGVVVHSAVRAPVAPAAAGIPSCAIGTPSSPSSATTATTSETPIATAAAMGGIKALRSSCRIGNFG